ncbi:MAG TPA: hypothetical protein VEZ17_08095 [Chitinophagaceae bacterium]|jgi:hypothetical protein|nr:hypothetical protein [Chitinophagaceae bacterium]
MEKLSISNTKNDEATAIFGTSSDAIVQGLANGDFVETGDDKNQIVNQQDQQEIVNPLETELKEEVNPDPSPVNQTESFHTGSKPDENQNEKVRIDGIEDEPEK